jgi:hypothetical protein
MAVAAKREKRIAGTDTGLAMKFLLANSPALQGGPRRRKTRDAKARATPLAVTTDELILARAGSLS